jgi:hypothetical protein
VIDFLSGVDSGSEVNSSRNEAIARRFLVAPSAVLMVLLFIGALLKKSMKDSSVEGAMTGTGDAISWQMGTVGWTYRSQVEDHLIGSPVQSFVVVVSVYTRDRTYMEPVCRFQNSIVSS